MFDTIHIHIPVHPTRLDRYIYTYTYMNYIWIHLMLAYKMYTLGILAVRTMTLRN